MGWGEIPGKTVGPDVNRNAPLPSSNCEAERQGSAVTHLDM